MPDGTPVARIHLHAEDGRLFEFYLRSGEHTADWSHDRPDIQAQVRQRRPPVATSNLVEDQQAGRYEGHTYVAGFALPERSTLVGGDIELMDVVGAPQLSLSIQRLSLIDETEDDALPLRADWIVKEPQGNSSGTDGSQLAHWRRLGETNVLVAFENTRALPRAWLASDARVMKEEEILGVIRSGKLPDGTAWDPLRTALVGAPLDLHEASVADASSRAEVVAYEPNRVEIKTTSSEPYRYWS